MKDKIKQKKDYAISLRLNREIFEHYDINKDGFIDKKEAELYFKDLCPSDTSSIESVIHEFIETYDEDQDGLLNFQEFKNWLGDE